ncbi:MAG: CTP synthase [Syntrophomonadaceae bacterium]|jgi:CTP synthase|nr:CTP synthase [Syntrophomonadaceae bacterium]
MQVIPHITNEIKHRVTLIEKKDNPDVVISEIGGTVGDIESLPFLEAIRQLKFDLGKENVLYIHVTLVPYIKTASELKTKPTQHSVKELRSIGIQPDILVCRTEKDLSEDLRAKLALFCDVDREAVIQLKDANSIYEVPLMLAKENLDKQVIAQLDLNCPAADLREWEEIVDKVRNVDKKVIIGLVGKYVELPDAYLSIVESLNHAGLYYNTEAQIKWIDAEDNEQVKEDNFQGLDAILVPSGSGERGIEGKIAAAKYARENKVPYLGICLGMQCAVIEFARNVCNLTEAHSLEFNVNTPHPVVSNGIMRLGAYPCQLVADSKAFGVYGVSEIQERHRHRQEINNDYRERLEQNGMLISGLSPDGNLVEIIELPNHPWFVGCQFHPEYRSRPNRPHPLFMGLIKAALENK